jgi:Ran GTPase-activating protein (RanGAP) involved in mRNA processing and transport
MPSLISLNLSSNPLGSSVLEHLASPRCRSLTLRHLDLSNCKLTDKLAIKLLHFVLTASSLESVNLSRNLLGFKTGAFLMNLLVAPDI